MSDKDQATKGAPREFWISFKDGLPIIQTKWPGKYAHQYTHVREVLPPESPGIESAEGEYPNEIYLWSPDLRELKDSFLRADPSPIRAYLERANPGYVRYILQDANPRSEPGPIHYTASGNKTEPLDAASKNTRSSGQFDEAAAEKAGFVYAVEQCHNKEQVRPSSIWKAAARWQHEQTLRSDVVIGLLDALKWYAEWDWSSKYRQPVSQRAIEALAAFDQAKGGE